MIPAWDFDAGGAVARIRLITRPGFAKNSDNRDGIPAAMPLSDSSIARSSDG